MTVLTDQESSWIGEVAQRLRLIQADVATSPPEQRRELLQEEVARSLKSVPPGSQKRYLEALVARFPVAGQTAQGSSVMAAAIERVPPARQSPEELLEMFLASATALSSSDEERREALAKRLAEAGFAWVDRTALVLEVPEEFRQRLGLPADKQPKWARFMQLTLLLLDAFERLNHLALKTLSEISPRNPALKRQQDFREAAGQFLSGSSESIDPQMQGFRSLVGGLLGAISSAGLDFGNQHLERFRPAAIEDVVRSEGSSPWFLRLPGSPNERERCWEKYKKLSEKIATADLIDRQFKDCIGSVVEKKFNAGR